jgi:hypothetical protein
MTSSQPGAVTQIQLSRLSTDSATTSAPQPAQRIPPPPTRSRPGSTPQIPPLNFSSNAVLANTTQLSSNSTQSNSTTPAAPSLALTRQNSTNALGLSQESVKGLSAIWKDLCTATNFLAIMGLVIGFTFGVAATKQTSVQSLQGTKSYELDLWNTCADHEAIQNTTTCKRVLSQSFDRFQKRGLNGLDPDIALRIQEIIVKRNNQTSGKMVTLNYESKIYN